MLVDEANIHFVAFWKLSVLLNLDEENDVGEEMRNHHSSNKILPSKE